jgi:hypothetical protein
MIALCPEAWNNVMDLYEARPTELGDKVALQGRNSGIYTKSGLPVIIDDMLKNKIDRITGGLSKDYTYDLSNVLGFAVHKGIIAYPFRILPELSGIDKNNHRQ